MYRTLVAANKREDRPEWMVFDFGFYWYQLQLMLDNFPRYGWWSNNVINILIRGSRWGCGAVDNGRVKWKVHYEGIGSRVTQVSSSNVRDLWFAPMLPVLPTDFLSIMLSAVQTEFEKSSIGESLKVLFTILRHPSIRRHDLTNKRQWQRQRRRNRH